MIIDGIMYLEKSNRFDAPTEYKLGIPIKVGENIISNEQTEIYTAIEYDSKMIIFKNKCNKNSIAVEQWDESESWIHKTEVK